MIDLKLTGRKSVATLTMLVGVFFSGLVFPDNVDDAIRERVLLEQYRSEVEKLDRLLIEARDLKTSVVPKFDYDKARSKQQNILVNMERWLEIKPTVHRDLSEGNQ